MTTTHSNESFPKRLKTASARIFSINNISYHLPSAYNNKGTHCCQLMSSPQHIILNPSKWFSSIRCRSTSSASSTFSLVFSSSSTSYTDPPSSYASSASYYYEEHHVSLETVSSELESLYNTAKEEIEYAKESQGSIYYEGDNLTAHAAFELCETRYGAVMQMLGDTANAIKFRFRWQADLCQLRLVLNSLPKINHSIYD